MTDLRDIGRDTWDALLVLQPKITPFLRFDLLHVLYTNGSVSPDTGWLPQYLTLWQGDPGDEVLAAAVPLYVRGHSYGECVFDWAWASAYTQHGLEYYLKWLLAIPFAPVQGARLLARDAIARAALVETLLAVARQNALSSLHMLFPTTDKAEQLHTAGMLLQQEMRPHWYNPGFTGFDDFLGALERKKRRNVRAKRRHIHDADITFYHVPGAAAANASWRFFHRYYRTTYREHRSSPCLNLEFFRQIGQAMPENLPLVIASRGGNDIANALLMVDMRPEVLVIYSRYWGTVEYHPCLRFEITYHQPLTYCIVHGIRTFEGGTQGEHGMARGFEPVATLSTHWLTHPAFVDVVGKFLDHETVDMEAYLDELTDRSPFRQRPESDQQRENNGGGKDSVRTNGGRKGAVWCSAGFCWVITQCAAFESTTTEGTAMEGDAMARSPTWAASDGPTSSAHAVDVAIATAESTGTTTILFNIAVPGVGVKLARGSRGVVSGGQMSVS